MNEYHERYECRVTFHQHNNGEVTMRAKLIPNRGIIEGLRSTMDVLEERLNGDDLIRSARNRMVGVLATWQQLNGVWVPQRRAD